MTPACFGFATAGCLKVTKVPGCLPWSLTVLVPAVGLFSLPFCDWCPLWVHSLSPSAVGARYGCNSGHVEVCKRPHLLLDDGHVPWGGDGLKVAVVVLRGAGGGGGVQPVPVRVAH
eukprot:1182866-Prorocentrum_minimum.AAC.2